MLYDSKKHSQNSVFSYIARVLEEPFSLKKYNVISLILALISVMFRARTDLCKATPISKISVLFCDKYSSNYSY